ncbi:MAG: hypothetical protein HZA03_08540 [Nitrospinae bacterium]|nr:hypothetical protein [Nitrospinota bacterium]
MLKRVVPVIAAVAVFSCGAAFAFTSGPVAAMQTLVVHASGAATSGVHASGAVTPTPTPTRPPTTSAPVISPPTLPAAPFPSVTAAPSAPSEGTVSPARGGFGLARGRGGSGETMATGELPARNVAVALLNGGQISATRMRMGLHNTLTVKSGKTVVAVALAQVSGIEFGEKDLGRLAVTVNMLDGSVLEGNVYPGAVFEFDGKGRVITTRAEEIATIIFPAE